MRVCRRKSDGEIIEAQSGSPAPSKAPDALVLNCIAAGLDPNDFDFIEMNDQDFNVLMNAQTASTQKRKIAKSLVLSRLTDGQLDQALSLMSNRQKERWRSADHPLVNVDDPELLAVLAAIGADPQNVLG